MVDVKTKESTIENEDPEDRRQNERQPDVLVEGDKTLPVSLAVEQLDVVAPCSLAELLRLENNAVAGRDLVQNLVGTLAGYITVLVEPQMDSTLCSRLVLSNEESGKAYQLRLLVGRSESQRGRRWT